MIRFYLIFFSCFAHQFVFAQEEESNNLNIGFQFGLQATFGDLSDRYGTGTHGDISLNLYSTKKGSQISLRLGFLSSDQVKEDILAPFRNENGNILTADGQRASISARMAGTFIGIDYAKRLIRMGEGRKAGLFGGVGVGIIQHRIKLSDFNQSVPIVADKYAKGLDRNTQGLYLKQSLFYGVRKKKLRLDIGFFIMEGFTSPKGSINFDTGIAPVDLGVDLIGGLTASWYINVSSKAVEGDIYY